MIDADLISRKNHHEVKEFLNIQNIERPVTVQFIGSEKNVLVKAVQVVEQFADIIDLNVGCIEEDFLQKRCGAALLKDLPRLETLLRAIVDATEKPVATKIRIGWTISTSTVSQSHS